MKRTRSSRNGQTDGNSSRVPGCLGQIEPEDYALLLILLLTLCAMLLHP